MAVAYFKQVGVAADQLVNSLTGGYADETFSSRAYRCYPHVAMVIDKIAALLGDVNHCQASFESERTRKYMPPELRSNS